MGLSFDDVIGQVKVPVRSVTICLNAEKQAEHDVLREQLEAANRTQTRMGEASEARELAERIQAIEAEMQESVVTFEFRGLSKAAMGDIVRRFPPKKGSGMQWDTEDGGPAFLSACSHDPKMDVGQAKQLHGALSVGQFNLLVNTAWLATDGPGAVPFSARASEVMNANASK